METATTMNTEHKEYATNSKANTALGLGIAGLGLSLLNTIGGGMAMCDESNKRHNHEKEHVYDEINAAKTLGVLGMVNGGISPWWGGGYGRFNYGGNFNGDWNNSGCINCEEKEIERKMAQNLVDVTKEHYQGRLAEQRALADAFFDAYKRDVDNSFMLYKASRDGFDVLNNKLNEAAFGLYKTDRDSFDNLNQKLIDSSFGLYKGIRDNKDEIMGTIWAADAKNNKKMDEIAFNLYKSERDDKDKLNEKISKLESKVDVMAAIRPYQDALINAKIDKNAIISDYNLSRRTCRMIEGELVLPNDPTVTGFKGADGCNCGL